MPTESLNPAVMFMHCAFCLTDKPEGETPKEYARQSVGATSDGDMVVWCERHDTEIAIIKNGTIDATFASVAGTSCSNCGCDHHEEEKGH